VIARDGAVRSVQSAKLTLDACDLERLWTPANLENLARTYWRFLSRVTLNLVRIVYTADSRSVVLIARSKVSRRRLTRNWTRYASAAWMRGTNRTSANGASRRPVAAPPKLWCRP